MIDIWLLWDPFTTRISIQATEPDDATFPRGPRGLGWKVRTASIDEDVYTELLSGRMSDEETDRIHRTLWTENGETAWPSP